VGATADEGIKYQIRPSNETHASHLGMLEHTGGNLPE
jgi:hypothetical protein